MTHFRVLRLQTAPLDYKSASESIRKFTALLKKNKLHRAENSHIGSFSGQTVCLISVWMVSRLPTSTEPHGFGA